MFVFKSNKPNDNIQEFGNYSFVKKNIKPVIFIYLVYFSLFWIVKSLDFNESVNSTLLFLWAFPILIMSFGNRTLSKYGFTFLCFWYLPYLYLRKK